MKNILFYTDTPNFGGAEKQMELLAKHLKPLGYQVSLACGNYSKLKQRKNELEDVYEKVYFLPTIHKHDPRHYSALKKLLKNEAFDLIHIHLWNPGSCRYAFWAARHAKIPIVTTEHDPFALSGLKQKIKQMTLARTDHMIVISSDNYRQMLDNYGQYVDNVEDIKNRLSLVHNGIEVDRMLDNMDTVSLIVEVGDVVITCIAELHPRKGHKYLFQAFEKLYQEMPSLHLVIVGIGPIENELKEKYGKLPNVHFLGWREDIPQILKASDVFVLPSLREAFGLAVIEAMASGVPVVATDNGGTKDIIEHGKSGFLVPPANSEKLAEAIRILLHNPDQKRDIEKEALERVRKLFTAKSMAKKTANVYEAVLKVPD